MLDGLGHDASDDPLGFLDDLRDEHQRADVPAVATGFATLGDDDVRPAVNRSPGLLDVHHFLHPQAANLMSLINKITWVAHVVEITAG
jgi:hypothetical protein